MIRFHRNGLRYEPFVDDVEQLRPGYWITITMGTDTFTPALTSPAGVVYGAPAKTLRTAIKRANDLCVINDALLQSGETKPVVKALPATGKASLKVEITIPETVVLSMLCSAFEGGSNYWIKQVNEGEPAKFEPSEYYPIYVWAPVNGGNVIVVDDEDREHRLDLTAIITGLQAMAARHPRCFADALTGNGDWETGDVFLQCCLWGETIYG